MALTKEYIIPYLKDKRTPLNKATAPRYTNPSDIPRILDKIYDDFNMLWNAINSGALETRSNTEGKVGDMRVIKDKRTGRSRIEGYTEDGWSFAELRLLDKEEKVDQPKPIITDHDTDIDVVDTLVAHDSAMDVGSVISDHATDMDVGTGIPAVADVDEVNDNLNSLATKINTIINHLNSATTINIVLNSLAITINKIVTSLNSTDTEFNSIAAKVNTILDELRNLEMLDVK